MGSLQDSDPRATESLGSGYDAQAQYATSEPQSGPEIPSELQPKNTAHPSLVIDSTMASYTNSDLNSIEDEPPQSVIHAPSGFSDFVRKTDDLPSSRPTSQPGSSSLSSDITLPGKPHVDSQKKFSSSPLSPPPLTTTIEPILDWAERSTPRAQTMEDFGKTMITSHLASDDWDGHDRETLSHGNALTTGKAPPDMFSDAEIEIKALRAALAECWSLCNTLASLSYIHRERSNRLSDAQEKTWQSCWRLCQELYNSQDLDYDLQINPTLDLCRRFCQTLFDSRSRDNELADSILRVSFELNNHLYNTHDRTLPDAFRERTLDFYITLCHRLMKQRSQTSESNTLLGACWSLAEMLFSIRQSKKEKRRLDEELLGSAVQACWELCDIFREGWTRHRLVESIVTPRHIKSLRDSDSGTPRPSEVVTKQATQHSFQPSHESSNGVTVTRGNPETPTTIFEEAAVVSPDDAPIQNIFVLGQGPSQISHRKWSSNTSSVSGHTQSSEQTSSTNTITTFRNDLNLGCIEVLIMKAAIDSGFQRNGPQSLSSFVKSLSSDAFGPMSWQISLLRNYKNLVAFDPGFRNIGTAAQASAVDIAKAVQEMVQSGSHLWLQDLYRLVFGFHTEEAMGREIVLHV